MARASKDEDTANLTMGVRFGGKLDKDPVLIAAEMFKPRTTDSFAEWMKARAGSWLNPAQKLVNDSIVRNRYTAVPSCHSAGKALTHGSLVQTLNGPVPIEQLTIDDYAIGLNGKAIRITGVFPQGIKDSYRVTFSDGATVDCSGDHLWQVTEFAKVRGRIRTQIRIASTDELLIRGLRYITRADRLPRQRFSVPLASPARYPVRELPIDPYILGAWIGDGSIGVRYNGEFKGQRLATPAISSWDPFIPEEVSRRLPSHLTIRQYGDNPERHQYHICNRISDYGNNSFRDVLVSYGLNVKSPERFIPRDYLLGSVKQRSSLLQGLMDTDGSTGTGATERASYSTNSLQLAQDVQELVRSLGGTARLRGPSKKSKTYAVLIQSVPGCPFKLPRKVVRWRKGPDHERFERFHSRMITDITPIGRFAQTCISVEAEDGLFLANGYTVTHNSFFAASKIGHFIDSHAIGTAFVVSTAPTAAQIESVVWRELTRVHAKADLRGRITRGGYPQWRIGEELVAFGRRPTETASLQGIHAKYILIILDEADGIDEQLWIAADTLASSGHARLLAIGNPDSADSHFARIIKPGSGWNVVRIDGLRTPNFTRAGVAPFPDLAQYMRDNGIPYADSAVADVPAQIRAEWRDVLLTPEWVAERMPRWGLQRFIDEDGTPRWRESALWLSKVRGVSPTEGSEGIIPLSWIERAMNRWLEWESDGKPMPEGREIYGVDVADSGKDETVVTRRIGHSVLSLDRIGQQDTDTTARRLAGKLQNIADSLAAVDGAGIGAGVVNQLRGLRLNVLSFVGASSADGMRDITQEFTFANKRTAAYWHLRELLDPVNGPDDVMLPPIEDLKVDLSVPTWNVRTGAVIAMEIKEKVVAKLKRSPDCGDSAVISFWPDSAPVGANRIYEYEHTNFVDDEKLLESPRIKTAAENRLERIEKLATNASNVFMYSSANDWEQEEW